MGSPLQASIEKSFYGVDHINSQVKKKFKAQQSVKNVMLAIIIDFLEKGATLNRASYNQLLLGNI